MTTAESRTAAARPDWRTPAVVVLCGCLIALLSFGVRSTFGLFTDPLSEGRGWSREVFALAIALQNLLWGIGQPFAGALADRYGSARVLAAGGLVYAAGLALMTVDGGPVLLHLSAGLLVGLGMSGASFPIVIAAFARRLPPERRAWAVGVATAAGSLGQFLVVPLGQAFILAYGWSTAALLLAAGLLLIPVLATAAAGARGAAPPAAAPAGEGFRETLALAAGHGGYRLLVAGFFVCGFQLAFITVHLPPYLTDRGASPQLAAWAIALIGLFNVVGSYGAGVLAGRWRKRPLVAFVYAARAAVTAAFLLLPLSTWTVLAFAAAMGLLWLSIIPPFTALLGLLFGTRYMGTLFGIAFLSHQVGGFLGVWLGGVLPERLGSYDPVWWLAVALGVAAALAALPVAERPAALARPAPA
jgi:predicted MFS family arabinose efflux permease